MAASPKPPSRSPFSAPSGAVKEIGEVTTSKSGPQVGDNVYIVGHGPAIIVDVASRQKGRGSRGKKKLKVKYPNGTYYHVSEDMILASETPRPLPEPSRASQCLVSCSRQTSGNSSEVEPQLPRSGPRRLEYLGRAFDDEGRNIATPSATFALVATMVGGGVLSLPYAMSQCGIALGTIALFLSAMASTWTLDMLVDCARCTGRDTFELIGHAAFGECSRKATVFLVFVLCWLALVAYSVLLSDLFVPVVQLLAPGVNDTFSNEALHKAVLCLATLIVSPMCFANGLSALRFLCFASVGSVVLVGIVIAVRAFESFGKDHKIDVMLLDRNTISVIIGSHYRWWPEDWAQALYVFPMFGVSFMCHFNALPTHQELQRPTRWRMRRVLVLTMSFTTALYLFIGVSGYIFAGSYTCGNILLNFMQKDPLVVFARAALGMVLMLNFPLICQPCRSALFRLISGLPCRAAVSTEPASTCLHGIAEDSSTTADCAPGSIPLVSPPSSPPPSSPPPTRPPASPPAPRRESEARVHVYVRDAMDATRGRSGDCVEALDSFLPKDETVQQSASEPTRLQRYLLTTAILGGCLLLSIFLESVLVVWSILGSTVCFLIGFILPAAFWRRIIGPQTGSCNRRASELLAGISILLAVSCTIQAATKLDQAACPPVQQSKMIFM